MIAWLALGVGIGATLAMFFQRLVPVSKEAPPAHSGGISALGFDMNNTGAPEVDPQYQRLVSQVLKQLDGGAGFRTLLP